MAPPARSDCSFPALSIRRETGAAGPGDAERGCWEAGGCRNHPPRSAPDRAAVERLRGPDGPRIEYRLLCA
ncbi:hypothetical protein PFLUV_G00253220 [Perca fluviatilis]|uniref:Uncharacterized protein n=1 Tax=Perca fluviatilis TaxID=8168 RepID=A0A6A5DN81_PERFL|nr:hypothetical protein PFLUV_G00253220 [Perca fluviatilis]